MFIINKIKNSLVIKMWLFEVFALSLILSTAFFSQKSSLKLEYYTTLVTSLLEEFSESVSDIVIDEENDKEKFIKEVVEMGVEYNCDLIILNSNYSIVYTDFTNDTFKDLSLKDTFYINESISYSNIGATTYPFFENFKEVLNKNENVRAVYDFNTSRVSYLVAFKYDFYDTEYIIIGYVNDGINTTVLDFYDSYIVNIYILVLLAVTLISYFSSAYFVKPIRNIEYVLKNFRRKDALQKLPIKRTDELGSLSRSIQMLNTQLENADGLHKEVFSNISHELKTPIVLIAGYSELVRDISWKDDKKRNEHLNLVIKEANRMTNMVNEILDYSQVANGYVSLTLDYTNLHRILQSEQSSAQATAVHYNLEVEYVSEIDTEIKVLVDSLRITQVMRNLLNNAINHSDTNSTIYIRSRLIDDGIKVSVENKGEKIPDVEKGLIFNRYFRAQHQNSRREGSGIGLSIVRSIYEAHDFEYGIDYIKGYNIFYFIIQLERIGDK